MASEVKLTAGWADLHILDLAGEMAAFCGKMLADLGAEVLKIEPPGGDPARNAGPFADDSREPGAVSLSFAYANAGKRCVTLDITHPTGHSIFLRLLKQADIFIETFLPAQTPGLGVDFQTLSEVNPKLIQVSVTGFGQFGPRRDAASSDLIAAACGGQMWASGSPNGSPLKAYGGQAAYSASLYAVLAVLLALRHRKQSGKGEHIDLSLQESVASNLGNVLVRSLSGQEDQRREGSRSPGGDFAILPCVDGYLQVSLFQKWETLVEWLASEGMAGNLLEEKWRNEAYRREHVEEILQIMSCWSRGHTAEDLFHRAQLMRLAWAPVRRPEAVLGCPQLKARDFLKPCQGFCGDDSKLVPGLPFGGSLSGPDSIPPIPVPGEHNLAVYTEKLGLSVQVVQQLAQDGII